MPVSPRALVLASLLALAMTLGLVLFRPQPLALYLARVDGSLLAGGCGF